MATGRPVVSHVNAGVAPPGYFAEYYSARDWRFYRSTLARVVEHSEPGPILDLGAGAGFFIEAAMRWGMKCEGLEGSAEGITIAHGRFSGIELRQHLLSQPLPFAADSFQTVVLNQVIEHLDSHTGENIVEESYRILRPRGMIFVSSPSRFNRRERMADPTHINLYTPRELQSLLSGKGFVDILSLDTPRDLLGASRIARGAMLAALRFTGWGRLSATANCIGYRRARGSWPGRLVVRH